KATVDVGRSASLKGGSTGNRPPASQEADGGCQEVAGVVPTTNVPHIGQGKAMASIVSREPTVQRAPAASDEFVLWERSLSSEESEDLGNIVDQLGIGVGATNQHATLKPPIKLQVKTVINGVAGIVPNRDRTAIGIEPWLSNSCSGIQFIICE